MHKIIDVNHSRKGKFRLAVLRENSEFMYGIIVSGTAAFLSEKDREEGEEIEIRKSLCTITVIHEANTYSKEYERGYLTARKDLDNGEDLAKLRENWEAGEFGDEYDKGYHWALLEAEMNLRKEAPKSSDLIHEPTAVSKNGSR